MGPWVIPALQIGGQLLGGLFGSRTNAANRRSANRHYNQLNQYVSQNMGPSQSPYAAELMQFMQGMRPTGTQGANAGQDALMQMLRREYSAPDMSGATQRFDNTDLFRALQSQDTERMNEQIAGLQGSAGTIGQRFGTAMNRNEADMRRGMANDQAVRNAGISSSSFEAQQQRLLQALGLQTQDRQAFDNRYMQAAQGLDQSTNAYNQLMMQGYGQAAGMQAQQQQSNTSLMALLAGIQPPQQQNSLIPQMLGNIGNTLQNNELMKKLMEQMDRNGGASTYSGQGGGMPMTGAWWRN